MGQSAASRSWLVDSPAPETCIETALDLLRSNAEARVGKHAFTRPSGTIACMGSNLGMALAVLAGLVTPLPTIPFSRPAHLPG